MVIMPSSRGKILLISIILLCSLLALTTSVAGAVTVTISPTTIKPGQTFTAKMSGLADGSNVQFEIVSQIETTPDVPFNFTLDNLAIPFDLNLSTLTCRMEYVKDPCNLTIKRGAYTIEKVGSVSGGVWQTSQSSANLTSGTYSVMHQGVPATANTPITFSLQGTKQGPLNSQMTFVPGNVDQATIQVNVYVNGILVKSQVLKVNSGAATVGSVQVNSNPSKADIYVDGVLWQKAKTPARITDLAPGTHNITVKKAGYYDKSRDDVDVLAKKTTTVAFVLQHEWWTPTITSISPVKGVTGTNVAVTLAGTNLYSGGTLNLTRTGLPNVTGFNNKVINDKKMSFVLPLPWLGDTDCGVWSLTLTYPNGNSTTLVDAFNITPINAPTVKSINPKVTTAGSLVSTTIAGTNFKNGAGVNLTQGATSIPGTVTKTTTGSISASFIIPWNAPTGLYNVNIQNPDGKVGTGTGLITINAVPSPTITKVSPNKGDLGGTYALTISGKNFIRTAPGDTVISLNQGATSIVATTIQVMSSTSMKATFVLPWSGTPTGPYSVNLTYPLDPAMNKAGLANAFLAKTPAPMFKSIDPKSGTSGTTVTVTVNGTKFLGTTTVQLERSGMAPITGSDYTSRSNKGLVTNLTLPAGATGKWTLKVMNGEGKNATKASAFTIT